MTKEEAVEAIVMDLRSRRGFGQVWSNLDTKIETEIIQEWIDIVASIGDTP